MNVIFGADPRNSGEIILDGCPINPGSPREAIEQGVAMIPEDRKLLALFDLRTVLENIAIVANETSGLILDQGRERTAVEQIIKRLHIVTAGVSQAIGFLSGGNQQKAILARWLLSKARVFIFDEPTKGVDIGAKEQIYDLMLELSREGKSILMVSSDMPELMSVSNRIAVMREGKLVTTVNSKNITEQELLGYFIGIDDDGGITDG
jgi:ribose transport system ATP-binding protein